MKSQKAQKILLVIGVVLLVIQLPWYIVVQAYANKTQYKTIATVIRIDSQATRCTGDRLGRPDSTCDHSDRLYPVYEYFDQQGKRHEQDDRFFGEYKENNPLGKLFLKKVGDKVPAYYTKDRPQEVVFMASPYAYTAWYTPLYIAIPVFIAFGIVFVINRLKK